MRATSSGSSPPKKAIVGVLAHGGEGDMKTNFDAYLRYEELTRALHALAEEHPGSARSSP